MNQFVPAADWSGAMGGAPYYFAPMPESTVPPWFLQQYPVNHDHVDVDADKDLFSGIFSEMAAAAAAAGSDTAGYNTPPPLPRGQKAGNAMSRHHASTTGGKRKRSDASDSTGEGVEEPESTAAATTTPGKRRRAAQEHNLSERRRRDRINDKMRALQQLVPHCSKTDRASMLDEAIQYLKSLQLQVQVMWTMGGGRAPPVMFPASGAQYQYMQRRSRMPPFRI